jgi:hypothetical protein
MRGDGNCYYRSVMFAYIERLVLFRDTKKLQDLVAQVENKQHYYNLEDNLDKTFPSISNKRF